MQKFNLTVDERIKELKKIVREKEKALKKAPIGVANVHGTKEKPRYYYKESSHDKVRKYIKENEKFLIKELCQKDYDEKVLIAAKQELKLLEKLHDIYQKPTSEEIYDKLHVNRKKYVNPILIPDEMYITNWKQESYEGKSFPIGYPEYYTDNGERVRSKSEVIIANMLKKYDIPYKYEKSLYLDDYVTMYPDFTVLNVRERKEKYFEHFGMMDDPHYAETAINKIETYAKNGMFMGDTLLATFESRNKPLNQKSVEAIIKKYLL